MDLNKIPSAWKNLDNFAFWLVAAFKPDVIVDLGVDHGYSTIVLAMPGIGTVYGIDAVMCRAEPFIAEANLKNIILIKGDFSTLASTWAQPIDILHIDGNHDYESVQRDFTVWSPFVRKGGIILLHDTISFPDGPGRVFSDVTWPKFNIDKTRQQTCGLGVILKTQ